MRQGWKRVAKRGDKAAFATEEIATALVHALKQDCVQEMGPQLLGGLCNVCREQERSLFKDQIEAQLEALKPLAVSGIGRIILDQAIHLAAAGEQGIDIAVGAVRNALTDRAARGARQVEEHYFRESTTPRARNVRNRIDQAINSNGTAIEMLARQVLKLDSRKPAAQPVRQQGLDDGVAL